MPKRSPAKRSLIIFGISLLIVVAMLALWTFSQSMAVVGEKTAQVASVMRVVRPLILVAIVAAWRPMLRWLQHQSWVTHETAERGIAFWPRLAIWTGLLELTLGQGLVIAGLLCAAGYWFILRRIIEP